MLYSLIRTDRPIEHHAFLRVTSRAVKCGVTEAHRFRSDEDPLGIQAMEQITKAFTVLAYPVFLRHFEAVDEKQIGIDRVTAHLGDFFDLHLRSVEVGIEKAQSLARFTSFRQRLGACDQ